MAEVETIRRDAFDKLVTRGDVTVFRYIPNSRGFIFLQICAALLFFIGFLVYLMTQFDPRIWSVLSIALVAVGLFLIQLVIKWSVFARKSAVAFDDNGIYVVKGKAVNHIAWTALSAETAGFSEQHTNGDHGTLNMRIGEKKVVLILFNPFAWVDDFPTFLVELLSKIKQNEVAEEPASEEPASEEPDSDDVPSANETEQEHDEELA